MEEKKVKFALWAYPETLEKVEKLYQDVGCRSKSEYIERAINFYSGYVTSENYRDYFPEVILSTVKGMLDSFENRTASLLFKNAVELDMLLHVIAATHQINEETLTRLRGMCVREVRQLNGKIEFDQAVKFQKGE